MSIDRLPAETSTTRPHPSGPPSRLPPWTSRRRAASTATAPVVIGLVVGIGTQVLQGVLPGNWHVLANSGVAWAMAAFAVGALMPSWRSAVIGGATAMVLATLGYYWAVENIEHVDTGNRGALVWSIAGLVAGPAFGIAGYLVRTRPEHRWLAHAPVAGILLGEGAHLVWFVGRTELRPAGVVELVLGGSLTVVCVAHDRRRLAVLGLVAGAAAVHRVASLVIDAGFTIPR